MAKKKAKKTAKKRATKRAAGSPRYLYVATEKDSGALVYSDRGSVIAAKTKTELDTLVESAAVIDSVWKARRYVLESSVRPGGS